MRRIRLAAWKVTKRERTTASTKKILSGNVSMGECLLCYELTVQISIRYFLSVFLVDYVPVQAIKVRIDICIIDNGP
jgi:hypothetical protein